MLRSMTGYGASAVENESYKVTVEMRSVNQRYLDISFTMQPELSAYEEMIKKCVKSRAARGKLTVTVSVYDKRDKMPEIHVNRELAMAYQSALNEVSDMLHLSRLDDVKAVIGCEGVMTIEHVDDSFSDLEPLLKKAADEAADHLLAMREVEGANIERDFSHRLEIIEQLTEALESFAPDIVRSHREKILKSIEDLLSSDEIDKSLIIQEAAMYADKVDYTEEITRLRSHIDQFRKIMTESVPVGRKLDFLIQEMNREVNTAASKANSAEASHTAVDIKSEIEKLREQVQNIE